MARLRRARADRRANGEAGAPSGLEKCATGIQGFDELTFGGLPRGRPTLICGGPGCGKTVFGLEFLVRGALSYGEAGVFVSFEESAEELAKNAASMGIDLAQLVRQKRLVIDHVHVERSEIEETGEYDLEGLFIRLGHAIDSLGARRVVLDTLESLFSGLSNGAILRAELRRLFAWLKDRGITAVITGERGEGALTRQGLEEYVSDCVILLENRVNSGTATRRLRIVKYRGSSHAANEHPFLIDPSGFSVLPITSLGLHHPVSDERISTGIARLDTMLGGSGYYRGSSILVSGTAGSGKTSIASHFAAATCAKRERCLYFAFEESEGQIVRNMRSIGLDLAPAVQSGLLAFQVSRPGLYGLEMHLALMHKAILHHEPSAVIVDPISNLIDVGGREEVNSLLVRLLDLLKSRGITALFTSLTNPSASAETTELGVSSIMDTWLLLRNLESSGERNRGLYVLKSRGMAHSNQIREFILSERGVELVDVYTGANRVLTGSARMVQQAKDAEAMARRRGAIEQLGRRFERKKAALVAKISELEAEIEDQAHALEQARRDEAQQREAQASLASDLSRTRGADGAPSPARARRNARNGQSEASS